MPRERRFVQVDVFAEAPLRGNPVAVVLDGEGLTDDDRHRFASWTNLSETTFVVPAEHPEADYGVRILTPSVELPFAGHPTLGTCHAWLQAGGTPEHDGHVVQECRAGLVPVRGDERLAFAAPPLTRSGPVAPDVVEEVRAALGVGDVVAAEWVVNGPEWLALLLPSAEAVLAVDPGGARLARDVGLVGLHPDGTPEVRAFVPGQGGVEEDPVTGSLNAGLALWLLGEGRLEAPYVARQGRAIGRDGRVHVDRDADGTVWVGGATATCITGTVVL